MTSYIFCSIIFWSFIAVLFLFGIVLVIRDRILFYRMKKLHRQYKHTKKRIKLQNEYNNFLMCYYIALLK